MRFYGYKTSGFFAGTKPAVAIFIHRENRETRETYISRLHPGPEITPIELDIFSLAAKPLN